MKSIITTLVWGALLVGCKSTGSGSEASAAKSFGDDKWCKAELQSGDGSVQISLDFKAHWEHGYVASPLWVNVTGRGVLPSNTVKLSMESHAQMGNRAPESEVFEKRQLVLAYDYNQRKFTKEVPNGLVMLLDQSGTQSNLIQAVKLTIDGRPVLDPVNGTDTFSVQLIKAMHEQNCL